MAQKKLLANVRLLIASRCILRSIHKHFVLLTQSPLGFFVSQLRICFHGINTLSLSSKSNTLKIDWELVFCMYTNWHWKLHDRERVLQSITWRQKQFSGLYSPEKTCGQKIISRDSAYIFFYCFTITTYTQEIVKTLHVHTLVDRLNGTGGFSSLFFWRFWSNFGRSTWVREEVSTSF